MEREGRERDFQPQGDDGYSNEKLLLIQQPASEIKSTGS